MKQILIVDDDIHIGNMLQEVLTKEGYGVSRAYSGTEAILFLSRNRPDLILLELHLEASFSWSLSTIKSKNLRHILWNQFAEPYFSTSLGLIQ